MNSESVKPLLSAGEDERRDKIIQYIEGKDDWESKIDTMEGYMIFEMPVKYWELAYSPAKKRVEVTLCNDEINNRSTLYVGDCQSPEEAVSSARRVIASQLQPSSPQSALVEALEEYIGVLGDEINDLIGMASVHGWQSRNVERGKELRDKISNLKSSQPSSPQLEQEVKEEFDFIKQRLEQIPEETKIKVKNMLDEIDKKEIEDIDSKEIIFQAAKDAYPSDWKYDSIHGNQMLTGNFYGGFKEGVEWAMANQSQEVNRLQEENERLSTRIKELEQQLSVWDAISSFLSRKSSTLEEGQKDPEQQ